MSAYDTWKTTDTAGEIAAARNDWIDERVCYYAERSQWYAEDIETWLAEHNHDYVLSSLISAIAPLRCAGTTEPVATTSRIDDAEAGRAARRAIDPLISAWAEWMANRDYDAMLREGDD